MKRGPPQHFSGMESPMKRGGGGPAQMCLKLLVSAKEASAVLGPGGSHSREISQQLGVKLHLSSRFQFYPGTSLQELSVKGPSAETVGSAVLQVLGKIAEENGHIACGENDVEENGVRLKFLLPVSVSKALIGRSGENIKNLRRNSGLHVHIEEVALGSGDSAEQIVSLNGNIMGVEAALSDISEKVAAFSGEPGFAAWVSTSHASSPTAVATQVAPMKGGKGVFSKGGCGGKGGGFGGKGCGPGGYGGKGKGMPPMADHMDNFSGWSRPQEAQGYGCMNAGFMEAQQVVEQEVVVPEGMEVVAGAIQSLPASLLDPSDRSQKISFAVPADCVSSVIGRGGAGVKEISAATRAKIQIRDVEGNPAEKTVTVQGSATNVAAAYLYLAGRVGSIQEMAAGLVPAEGMEEMLN